MDNEIKNLFYATDKFLHFFSDNLNKSEEASDYLENRNIEKDTIKKFKIGYCPKIYDNILNFMDLEKIDHEIAKKIGIIKYDDNKKMYIPFSNRIVFPIFNPYDECVGFSCRTLKSIKPKYINSPTNLIYQKRRTLYGLSMCKNELYKRKYVFIVEGNLDVIKCHQEGLTNIVCPMGTAFTEEQCKILKRYVNSIVIMFDGDEAGRKASKDAKILIKNYNLKYKIIKLPIGYDPDSFIDKYGIRKLKFYLKHILKGKKDE